MNAKIGTLNVGNETIMGKEAIGTRNENDELFIKFCVQNSFLIGGSVFPRRNVHKTIWTSFSGKTHSQIDHTAITRR